MNMNKVRNTSTLVSNLNNASANCPSVSEDSVNAVAAEDGVTCKSVSRAPRMAESIAAKLKEKLCYMIDTKSLSLREAASKLGLSVTKAKEILKDTITRKRLVTETVNETSTPAQGTQQQQLQQQITTAPAQLQSQMQLLTNGSMNCLQYQYTINIDTVIEMIYCLPGLPPMSMQTLITDTITTDMVFTYLDSPANISASINDNNTITTSNLTTATATPTAVDSNNQSVGDFTNYANLLAAAAMMGSLPTQNTTASQMTTPYSSLLHNAPLSPMASGGVLPQIGLWN